MNENYFEYNGKKFYAEGIPRECYENLDCSTCGGCFFYKNNLNCNIAGIPACDSDNRKDKRHVIFKEFEYVDKTICFKCSGNRFCVLKSESKDNKIYMWVCSECGNREEEIVEK